jgi:hypothetical protein
MSSPDLPSRFIDASGDRPISPNYAEGAGRLVPHGPITASQGSGGALLAISPDVRTALFEIRTVFERRLIDGAYEDAPSAMAIPVEPHRSLEGGGGGAVAYQADTNADRNERVYHIPAYPTELRETIQAGGGYPPDAIGVPRYAPGDWTPARWNPRTGRWEIFGDAERVWRFELLESLWPTSNRNKPGTATARLVAYDPEMKRYEATSISFQVIDFYNVYLADAGTRGYARRMGDSRLDEGWEIVSLEPNAPTVGDPSSSSTVFSSSSSPTECMGVVDNSNGVHYLTFAGVANQDCSACANWNATYEIRWAATCLYEGACDAPSGGAHPCDSACDTSVQLTFFRDVAGTLRAYVSVYEAFVLSAIFSKTLTAAEELTPFEIEGIICVYDNSSRCDWSSATCDIDS